MTLFYAEVGRPEALPRDAMTPAFGWDSFIHPIPRVDTITRSTPHYALNSWWASCLFDRGAAVDIIILFCLLVFLDLTCLLVPSMFRGKSG